MPGCGGIGCGCASDDPVAQLAEVERAFGIEPAARFFTRCIRCNVALRAATAAEVAEFNEIAAELGLPAWDVASLKAV